MGLQPISFNSTFGLFAATEKSKTSFNLKDVCIKVKDFVLNIFYTLVFYLSCCKKDFRKLKVKLEGPAKPDPVDPKKPDPVDPKKPDPVDPKKPDPVNPKKPGPVDPEKSESKTSEKGTKDVPVGIDNAPAAEDAGPQGETLNHYISNVLFQDHLGKENACEVAAFNNQCLFWSELDEDGNAMIHSQIRKEFDFNSLRERISLKIEPNGNVSSILWAGADMGFTRHNSTFTRKVIRLINRNFSKPDQQIRLVPISYFTSVAHKYSALLEIVAFTKDYQSPENDNFFTHRHIAEGKQFGICPSIAKECENTTTLCLEGLSFEHDLLTIEYDIETSTGTLISIRVNGTLYEDDSSYPETEIWLSIIKINLDRLTA